MLAGLGLYPVSIPPNYSSSPPGMGQASPAGKCFLWKNHRAPTLTDTTLPRGAHAPAPDSLSSSSMPLSYTLCPTFLFSSSRCCWY